MRLTDLLTPDRIRIPLQAADKEGVLRELVGVLLPNDGGQGEEVLAAILERERQFPTGIGHGVAVPHGRTPAMTGLGIVAGTSPNPGATRRSMASRCGSSFSWRGRKPWRALT